MNSKVFLVLNLALSFYLVGARCTGASFHIGYSFHSHWLSPDLLLIWAQDIFRVLSA
jgi:hypothetical protein